MPAENKAYIHPKTGNYVSPKGRILWYSLEKPRKAKAGKEGKFEFNLLFPKDADHSITKENAVEVGKEKFGKTFREAADAQKAGKAKSSWPASIKTPFKKTAENEKLVAALEAADVKVEDFPVYIGYRSSDKPGVVGPNGKSDGIDGDQIYSGRWAKCTHDMFAYDAEGNKGVSCGLKNVQLLDNDEELTIGGGRVSAETEFDAVEGAGDDSKSSDSVFD
jgi:hypothetical protein